MQTGHHPSVVHDTGRGKPPTSALPSAPRAVMILTVDN
jgi:hypothetical protein